MTLLLIGSLICAQSARADYLSAVLNDHPLAYYPLNLATDTNTDSSGYYIATDFSGNGNNGAYVGIDPGYNNATGPTAYITNGISFDGGFTYVDLSVGTNTALLNFGGQITLEAWVQPANTSKSLQDIIAKGYDANLGDAETALREDGTSFNAGGVGAPVAQNGVWSYIVATYDGTNWNLYANGVHVATAQNANGASNFADPWAIGSGTEDGASRLFAGDISQVAIYNYGLSPSQVFNHYFVGEYGVAPSNSVPIITKEPTPQVAYLGGTATFTVGILSVLPTTNQWYKNSTPLSGQTNATLILTNVDSGELGNYSVVVGNSNGTSNSSPAGLSLQSLGIYQNTVINDHPLAYFPLDPSLDTTNVATDLSGNGDNATYYNTSAGFNSVAGPTAYITNAAYFDGATYADLGAVPLLDFGGQVTLEAWVQPANVTTAFGDIIAKGYDANLGYLETVLSLNNASFNANGGSGGIAQPGVWAYVASTYDGTNWNTYVNGTVVAQAPSSSGSASFPDPWRIGSGSADGASRLFTGSISQAAIYDYGLTPAQIQAHYFVAQYGGLPSNSIPIITAQPTPQVSRIGGSSAFSVSAYSVLPIVFQWYKNNNLIAGQTNATLTIGDIQSDDVAGYSVTINNKNGATNSIQANLSLAALGVYPTVVLNDHPLAYFPLDPAYDTTNTATDFSGNGNNATYYNTSPGFNAVVGPSTYITNAASFNGTTFADLGNVPLLDFAGQITLEAWVQPANLSTSFGDIVAKGYDASLGYAETVLSLDGASYNGNGGGNGGAQVGVWAYVASTYDGTNWNTYVNGAVTSQRTEGGAVNFLDPWRIGSGSADGASRLFTGNISEVAIYGYGLTPAQIQSHYQVGLNGPIPPLVTTSQIVGNKFVISGSSGVANGGYYVLVSTNLAAPVATWTILSTNTANANGAFVLTNNVNLDGPRQFYRIRLFP